MSIRHKGVFVYNKCYGYANLQHQVPIDSNTVFHIASVSKQFTVMALLLCQEDGLLNIDDEVRNYVPEYIGFSQPVTLRQMMNNISGIQDIWELQMMRGVRIDDTITQQDALSIIASQKELNFKPGSRYCYSNSNFVLLAAVVEKVTKKTLQQFLKERVFDPLDMKHTQICENYWQWIPNRAESYYNNGLSFQRHVLNYGCYGATALNSTANDLMKWLAAFGTDQISSKAVWEQMFQVATVTGDEPTTYAGGLEIGDTDGKRYVEHGGSDASFRAYVRHYLDEELDIVLLSNTQAPFLPLLMERIVNLIFGRATQSEALSELCIEDTNPKEAIGIYYKDTPDYFYYDIEQKADGLYIKEQYVDTPLFPVNGNRFRIGAQSSFYLDLEKDAGRVSINKNVTPLKKELKKPDFMDRCYEGRYESGELETAYEIKVKDGYLYAKHFRNGEIRLVKADKDRFIGQMRNLILEFWFKRNSQNEMEGFLLSSDRVWNVNFNRKK